MAETSFPLIETNMLPLLMINLQGKWVINVAG